MGLVIGLVFLSQGCGDCADLCAHRQALRDSGALLLYTLFCCCTLTSLHPCRGCTGRNAVLAQTADNWLFPVAQVTVIPV